MTTELPEGYVRPKPRRPARDRLTIRSMLAITLVAAVSFAVLQTIERELRWMLVLAIPPLLGSIYGAFRKGFGGLLEGAFWGAMLIPSYVAFMFLVAVGINLFLAALRMVSEWR